MDLATCITPLSQPILDRNIRAHFRARVIFLRAGILLRGLLLLDLAERHLQAQRRKLKQRLIQAGIKVLDIHEDDTEFRVRFRENNLEHEAIYMRAMLDAELQARMNFGGNGPDR